MKKRYGTWKILWIISLAGLMVLYSAVFLQAGLLEDLVRMFPGREACKAAAGVFHTKADCDRAFDQLEDAASQAETAIESGIDSVREAGEEGVENLQEMGEQALDCVSDSVACGQRIYDGLVNTVGQTADEARENMALAKLQGTVRDESGNPLKLIPVRLSVDESNADTGCKAAVAIWRGLNAGLLGSGTVSSPIDGTYFFMVPACGEIIYTISPVNPLLTWSPPSRKVTVTPGGGTGGQAFQVEHTGVVVEGADQTSNEGSESDAELFIIQQEAESTTGSPEMGIDMTETNRKDTTTETLSKDATSGAKSETKTDEPSKDSTSDTKADTTAPSKTQETEKSDIESDKKESSSSGSSVFRSGY